jgi:hypothetical protein
MSIILPKNTFCEKVQLSNIALFWVFLFVICIIGPRSFSSNPNSCLKSNNLNFSMEKIYPQRLDYVATPLSKIKVKSYINSIYIILNSFFNYYLS